MLKGGARWRGLRGERVGYCDRVGRNWKKQHCLGVQEEMHQAATVAGVFDRGIDFEKSSCKSRSIDQ